MENKKPQHTKPFCLEHAKAGAPIACRNGMEVTILKWESRALAGGAIIGICGEFDVPHNWHKDGTHPNTDQLDLVMTPLGYIDGKPVFAGDVLEEEGQLDWDTFTVGPTMRQGHIGHCRWPAPEKQYPVTGMTGTELFIAARETVRNFDVTASGGKTPYDVATAIANAALRHAIDAGQVVAPEGLSALQDAAVDLDEWRERTDWVQEQLGSFPFPVLGQHRADVLKRAIEQLRADYKQQSMELGKAERLLETLGYHSAGDGEWKAPASRHFFGQVNGFYVEGDSSSIAFVKGMVEHRAARDMAIAEAVRDACHDAVTDSPGRAQRIREVHLTSIIEQVKP